MSLRFADDGYLKFCFQMISEKGLAGGRVLSGNLLTIVLMCNSVNISETEHLVNDDCPFFQARLHF